MSSKRPGANYARLAKKDRKKLEVQLKQLEAAYRDSKTEADRVRSQLKGLQSSPTLQTSDHASLLKQISDLQEQLTKVTNERDDLQSQMDAYQTVRVRDAPLLAKPREPVRERTESCNATS